MTDNKFYYGSKHNFSSRKEDLFIELASGPDEQLYTENLRTGSVFYSDESDALGFSQLGTPPTVAEYQHTDTTNLKAQGTSISISYSNTNKYMCIGCPVPGGELGGVGPFKSTGGAAFIQSNALTQTSFTTNAQNGIYSDINEEGDLIIFTDYAENSSVIQTYRRSGETWSSSNNISGGGGPCKVNSDGNDYVLSSTNGQGIEVFLSSGGAYSGQQELVEPVGALNTFYAPLDLYNSNTAIYSTGTSVVIWTRVIATWTQIQSIALADVTGLNIRGTILAICTAGTMYIYERADVSVTSTFTLTNQFDVAGITDICTNGTYVFLSNASAIRIYSKVGSVWVRSFNNAAITNVTKLACSDDWLAMGTPTVDSGNGGFSVFPISSYTSELVTTNSVVMDGTNLTITSVYGSVLISPPAESGSFSNGTVSSPSITFTSDLDTGLYRISDGAIGVACNGVNAMSITSTTTTVPAIYSFNGYGRVTNNTITPQVIANATFTTVTNVFFNNTPELTGDAGSTPTFSAGFFTVNKAGLYLITYSVGFTQDGSGTGSRMASIQINSAGAYGSNSIRPSAANRAIMSGSSIQFLAVAHTVSLQVFQSSGGDLNMDIGTRGEFCLTRLG